MMINPTLISDKINHLFTQINTEIYTLFWPKYDISVTCEYNDVADVIELEVRLLYKNTYESIASYTFVFRPAMDYIITFNKGINRLKEWVDYTNDK